jgi:tryptophan synthase alpha chain
MNRINQLFINKPGNILSVYFTAGHPEIGSAPQIIKELANSGADMIEIGMPFSDPMADGPIIQNSSALALKNGMSLRLLFQQLKNIRSEVNLPLLLMGYLNPVLQFGMEKFCDACAETGIDGVILPDMPLQIYEEEYSMYFRQKELANIFLISPQTSLERIHHIDNAGNGFIYMVSSSSTTGMKDHFSAAQTAYFKRVSNMNLKNPLIVGFGISSHEHFTTVCQFTSGAIIGSAFVKMLAESKDLEHDISMFISNIRGE